LSSVFYIPFQVSCKSFISAFPDFRSVFSVHVSSQMVNWDAPAC